MARLEQVFSIDELDHTVNAKIAFDDTATRAQLKARGYRWDSLNKAWWVRCETPAQVRAEALALRDLGLALYGDTPSDQPLGRAQTAVRYALPLPFPVAFWGRDEYIGLVVEGSPRFDYTITADGDWDGHLLRGMLQSVAMGERGQRMYDRWVADGQAVTPDSVEA